MIDFHSQLSIIPEVYDTATLQDNLEHSGGISLSWKSKTDDEIPLGSYLTYGGTRYVLMQPYAPSKESPVHYHYNPTFKHPQALFDFTPFWIKSKDAQGNDINLRTTSYTGFPYIIAQKLVNFMAEYANEMNDTFFAETIGLTKDANDQWQATWTFNIPQVVDGEGRVIDPHTIITVAFDGSSIKGAADSIATAMGCNVFFDWSSKTIRFVAGTTIQGESYNCFHVLGGTTNMGKNTASGSFAAITQRLTLDETQYPGSIIKRGAALTQGGIMLTKELIFDDIYPKMELYISYTHPRICYLTNEEGDFIVDHFEKDGQIVSGDTEGATAVYKTYTKWYIRLSYDPHGTKPYKFNQSTLIDDKPLSLLFQMDYRDPEHMSALVGRQFEMTYFPSVGNKEWDKTDIVDYEHAYKPYSNGEEPDSDPNVISEFRIALVAEGDVLLPTSTDKGLYPKAGDKVTLVNVALTDEKSTAQGELLAAAQEIIELMETPAGEYTETVILGKEVNGRTINIVVIGQETPFEAGVPAEQRKHGPVVTQINHNLDTDVADVTVGSWTRKTRSGGTSDKLETVTVSANSSTNGGDNYSNGSIGEGGGYGGNSNETLNQTTLKPDSLFVASLSNTIDAVSCDADGKVRIASDIYTKIDGHYGTKDVTAACTVAVAALPPVDNSDINNPKRIRLFIEASSSGTSGTEITQTKEYNSYDLSESNRWLRISIPLGYDMSRIQDTFLQTFLVEHPAYKERQLDFVVNAMRQGINGIGGAFKSRAFTRTNTDISGITPTGGNYNSPLPTNSTVGTETIVWSDGIPQGTAKLWSTVRTFYQDSTVSSWSNPAQETDTATLDIEFSPSATKPSAPSGNTPFADHRPDWYDPSNLPSGQTMIWRAERKVSNGVFVGDWVITRIYGEKGNNGGNTATVMLYKRLAEEPQSWDMPTIMLWYDFEAKKLYTSESGTTEPTDAQIGGWSLTIPNDSTDPIYVTAAIAYSASGRDDIETGEWVTPAQYTENGSDGAHGINSAAVFLYQRYAPTTQAPLPAKPTKTLYYKFADGQLYTKNGNVYTLATLNDRNNWELTIPATNGNPCFVIQAAALSAEDYDDIEVTQSKDDWSSIRKLVEDGKSIKKASEDTYRYATNDTGVRPAASSADWSPTKPTLQAGYWLYIETTIHWSDDSTTVLYTDERNPNDGNDGMDIVVDGATEMKYAVTDTNETIPTTTAKWDWRNAVPSTITNHNQEGAGASGTIASDVSGFSITYLGQTASTYVKIQYYSDGYAQMNTGTVLRIPVQKAGDVINVISYPGQSNFTLGGEDATDNFSHAATAEEAAQGYVEMIATATSYLYSITATIDTSSSPVFDWKDYEDIASSIVPGTWLWCRATTYYRKATSTPGSHDAGSSVNYSVSYNGENGNNGRALTSITEYYKATNSSSAMAKPTSHNGWDSDPNLSHLTDKWNESHKYLWNMEEIVYTESNGTTTTEYTIPQILAIWTKDGSNGSDGRGIDSIQNKYCVTDSNETPAKEGQQGAPTWYTAPQAPGQGEYLWNYEIITWINPSGTTETDVQLIGYAGTNGVSISKSSADTYKYAVSQSGSTTPSTWYDTKQEAIDAYTQITGGTWPKNTFMWTKTIIHWNVGDTVLYSAERNPDDGEAGMGIYIDSQSVQYCKKDNEHAFSDPSTIPAGDWDDNYPTSLSEGDWVYTKTTVNYKDSDGTSAGSTVTYSSSFIGMNGAAGKGVSGVTEHYLASNKNFGEQGAPVTPTDGSDWTTNPNVPDQQGNTQWNENKPYLWNYEKVAYTSGNPTRTAASVIAIWTKDGNNGKGVDSITNFYKKSNKSTGVGFPSADPDGGGDAHSGGTETGWNSVVQVPDATDPYLWNYERIKWIESDGSYSYDYTDPHVIGHFGKDGTSVIAQYAPNNNPTEQQIHNTFQSGDKYMRTSSDGGVNWSGWQKIVGEDGKDGKDGENGDYTVFSFNISDLLTGVNGSTAYPDHLGYATWQDAPPATTSTMKYLWCEEVRHTFVNGVDTPGTASYFRITGEEGQDGTSPYVADLDNEMDSVACTLQGKPSSAQSVVTNAILNYGSGEINFKVISIKKNNGLNGSYGTGVTVKVGDTIISSASSFDSLTASDSAKIEVSYATTATINGKDVYTIVLQKDGDTSIKRALTLTINGVRPGQNGQNGADGTNIRYADSHVPVPAGTTVPDGFIQLIPYGSIGDDAYEVYDEENDEWESYAVSLGETFICADTEHIYSAKNDGWLDMGRFTGSSPTIYNLKPSQSQINVGRTDIGGYDPSTVSLTCKYTQRTGDSPIQEKSITGQIDSTYNVYFRKRQRSNNQWQGYYYLYYSYFNTPDTTYSLTGFNVATFDAVEFIMCTAPSSVQRLPEANINQYTVIDRETVPIVSNGMKGRAGDDGCYYLDEFGRASSRELDNSGYPSGLDNTLGPDHEGNYNGWQLTAPEADNTYPYIWKRSRLWDPNEENWAEDSEWSYVCETGKQGPEGDDAPFEVRDYALGNSYTTHPTGVTWQATAPDRTVGTFVWMRIRSFNGGDDPATATPQNTSYVCITGDPGQNGGTGHAGRWYDYAGVWGDDTSSVTNTANVGYYVLYYYNDTSKHFYMNTMDDGVANTTPPADSSGVANSGWEQIQDDREYYIVKAIFGDYAQFGSFIINGNWMISTNGTIDGVAYNNGALYHGSSAYTYFDEDYPNTNTGSNFIPNFAINGLTGETYQNLAHVRGEIEAESGHIGGFVIGNTQLKSSDNNIVLDSNNQKISVGIIDIESGEGREGDFPYNWSGIATKSGYGDTVALGAREFPNNDNALYGGHLRLNSSNGGVFDILTGGNTQQALLRMSGKGLDNIRIIADGGKNSDYNDSGLAFIQVVTTNRGADNKSTTIKPTNINTPEVKTNSITTKEVKTTSESIPVALPHNVVLCTSTSYSLPSNPTKGAFVFFKSLVNVTIYTASATAKIYESQGSHLYSSISIGGEAAIFVFDGTNWISFLSH